MKVGYSRGFKKQYRKLPVSLRDKFKMRLKLFFGNQRDQLLNIHKLHGKSSNLYSMNVTGDIRAVFEQVNADTVEFVAIGTHGELYS